MRKDQILLDSIGPRLLLGWGKAVASQPDLPPVLAENFRAVTNVLRNAKDIIPS